MRRRKWRWRRRWRKRIRKKPTYRIIYRRVIGEINRLDFELRTMN